MHADVFNKFKDDKGEFKSCLIDDVKGMLSLYEAAHIRFHGEDVLDEALIFTTTNLTSMMKSSTSFSCSPLGRQVKHSLDQPFHKAISRLEARKYYISFYQLENEKLKSDSVIRLAKLSFKLVQALYKQELSDLSRWWRDLDLVSKLPFFRDRLVESYFLATVAYFEPSDSLSRVFMAKLIIFISVVDDSFDVYGTIEELKLFTDAFESKGKTIPKETFEWLRGAPKPLRSSGLIVRLINDIASHQFEQQRGHVASSVECYMKEFGVLEEEACDEIQKMMEEAWKDLNEECFTRRSAVLPWPLPLRLVSLTRMANLIYKNGEDTYTRSSTRMKENATLLYIDPVDPSSYYFLGLSTLTLERDKGETTHTYNLIQSITYVIFPREMLQAYKATMTPRSHTE
ncbi:hypothetical protein Scep_013174 [Stephania cephalantha]|uniref:Uncharacterized protein n=1 Tax=Stephania cephalantha TaxID=152367 RepID=A0AAP0PAI6_9MAGN